MRKYFIIMAIVLMVLIPTASFSMDIGKEIPTDKRLHALTSYVITDVLHERLGLSGLRLFLAVNAIGISKELLDEAYGGNFDTNDLIANNVGYLTYNMIRWEW